MIERLNVERNQLKTSVHQIIYSSSELEIIYFFLLHK